jgi:hypothetical protein
MNMQGSRGHRESIASQKVERATTRRKQTEAESAIRAETKRREHVDRERPQRSRRPEAQREDMLPILLPPDRANVSKLRQTEHRLKHRNETRRTESGRRSIRPIYNRNCAEEKPMRELEAFQRAERSQSKRPSQATDQKVSTKARRYKGRRKARGKKQGPK